MASDYGLVMAVRSMSSVQGQRSAHACWTWLDRRVRKASGVAITMLAVGFSEEEIREGAIGGGDEEKL